MHKKLLNLRSIIACSIQAKGLVISRMFKYGTQMKVNRAITANQSAYGSTSRLGLRSVSLVAGKLTTRRAWAPTQAGSICLYGASSLRAQLNQGLLITINMFVFGIHVDLPPYYRTTGIS